tara:strand:+ start:8864 stop:9463 length:600 start_codon:yes stop_codon:yes gene_type:complete
MTTKLEAINQMLSGIGQAPVVSLDSANPEIAIALDVLEAVDREVQGEGWHFNTEIAYPFTADANGNISVPSNVLQLSDNKFANNQKYQTVLRDGKLYDKIKHTYTFPANKKVKCDVVWKFDFEDLAQVFKDYITQRAARVFAGRVLGSTEMVTFNQQDEGLLRANCLAYDTQTAEVNIFGQENGQNTYISYTPFRAIAR